VLFVALARLDRSQFFFSGLWQVLPLEGVDLARLKIASAGPSSWKDQSHGKKDNAGKTDECVKYIGDRALHLANAGYTMPEIGELVKYPPELDKI